MSSNGQSWRQHKAIGVTGITAGQWNGDVMESMAGAGRGYGKGQKSADGRCQGNAEGGDEWRVTERRAGQGKTGQDRTGLGKAGKGKGLGGAG